MDDYKDPIDVETKHRLYEEIKEIKSPDEAYNFVKKYAPDWIVEEITDYAHEYQKFKENWAKICTLTHSPPRRILIVDKIIFDDPNNEYTILKMMSEILTRAGYCIRRMGEFRKCEMCGLGISFLSQVGKCVSCGITERIENEKSIDKSKRI